MGLIHIDLFTTLDGVAQAPGGPEEDTEGGFAFGGWQAPLFDEVVGEQVVAGMAGLDALLLGRKTYDIFAGLLAAPEDGIDASARLFNGSRSTSRHGATRRWTGPARRCSGPTSSRAVRGGARPSRERARHRQPRLRADAARRAALRPAHAVGLPDRARQREEGLRRRRRADQPHPRRAGRAPRRRARCLLRYALAGGIPGTGNMADVVQGAT